MQNLGGKQSALWGIGKIENIVTSVFSLADRTLEKAFVDSGKLDLGLVSVGPNGFEQ